MSFSPAHAVNSGFAKKLRRDGLVAPKLSEAEAGQRFAVMPDSSSCLRCDQFTQFLVDQGPRYSKAIIKSMRATDCAWLGQVPVGSYEAFNGAQQTQDRFESVWPDTTKIWETVNNTSCVGTPCDPPEHEIGMGSTRLTFSLQRQSWRSQLFCFDQLFTITAAKEHIAYLISDVLAPATKAIMANLFRRSALALAGQKWLATAAMPSFTATWETTGDAQIYLQTNGTPTSKLTPQMLQRRYHHLWSIGSRGCAEGQEIMLELVTDLETLWEINKTMPVMQVGAVTNRIKDHWQFTDWSEAAKFFKYGWSGRVGNYAVRVDAFPLRFNSLGSNRFQLVPPFVNVAATTGIKSVPNPDYANAAYQMSFIHDRRSFTALVFKPESVSSQMPFGSRDFGGNWKFAVDNIGCPNPRRNKGYFFADFLLAIQPRHTEWTEAIFHMREPAKVVEEVVTPVAPAGLPYNYGSANTPCAPSSRVLTFYPQLASGGTYKLAANSIVLGNTPLTHTAIDAATLAALATALTAAAPQAGTWAVSGSAITLTGSAASCVTLAWLAS